jgi:cytochrome P450
VDRLLLEEIQNHRQHPEGRTDILAHLISASDENGRRLADNELLDQLVTLLLAGHETTATALSWVFERLTRHPEIMDRLCAELEAGEGDDYLEAVINESLRLRPVVANIGRYVAASVGLGPYLLPEGVRVFASISLVQTSEAFEESDRFWPERFLVKPPAPYTFIPFGGGVHRCIGANFAMMEMKTVVRTVLKNVAFAQTAEPPEGQKAHHITLEPARGARVTVTHRLPKGAKGARLKSDFQERSNAIGSL